MLAATRQLLATSQPLSLLYNTNDSVYRHQQAEDPLMFLPHTRIARATGIALRMVNTFSTAHSGTEAPSVPELVQLAAAQAGAGLHCEQTMPMLLQMPARAGDVRRAVQKIEAMFLREKGNVHGPGMGGNTLTPLPYCCKCVPRQGGENHGRGQVVEAANSCYHAPRAVDCGALVTPTNEEPGYGQKAAKYAVEEE